MVEINSEHNPVDCIDDITNHHNQSIVNQDNQSNQDNTDDNLDNHSHHNHHNHHNNNNSNNNTTKKDSKNNENNKTTKKDSKNNENNKAKKNKNGFRRKFQKPESNLPIHKYIASCYELYKKELINDYDFIAAYLLLFSQHFHPRGWR
eukprot:Pgem_evm1s5493